MRVEPNSKSLIEKIHLISGQSIENTRDFFESLFTVMILDYLEGKSTILPFIGKLKIDYNGDKIKKGKKQAQINFDFKASDNLLKNIGQIEDNFSCDLEELFKKKIRINLEKIIKNSQ